MFKKNFSGRPIRQETTGPIFTKFLVLVELWKGFIMAESILRSL